jgi:hypothetical protein
MYLVSSYTSFLEDTGDRGRARETRYRDRWTDRQNAEFTDTDGTSDCYKDYQALRESFTDEGSLFLCILQCRPPRLLATSIHCVWCWVVSLFSPQGTSEAYTDLPTVLTIVHFDGTHLIPPQYSYQSPVGAGQSSLGKEISSGVIIAFINASAISSKVEFPSFKKESDGGKDVSVALSASYTCALATNRWLSHNGS